MIFSVLLFFGRQPTESLYDMTLFLFKILKEGVVVQWLARRGFHLKVGAFLRHKSVLHVVSLHPAVQKWVVSLDKARGTKVIQDRSRSAKMKCRKNLLIKVDSLNGLFQSFQRLYVPSENLCLAVFFSKKGIPARTLFIIYRKKIPRFRRPSLHHRPPVMPYRLD